MKVSIRHSFLGCHQSSSRESSRICPLIWLLTAGFTHWQNLPVCTHTYHCTFDWILSPKEWVFLKSGIFALFPRTALNFDQSSRLSNWQAKKEWTLSTTKYPLYITNIYWKLFPVLWSPISFSSSSQLQCQTAIFHVCHFIYSGTESSKR